MPLFYKKVDALQLVLTDQQKENIRNGKQEFFDKGQIKHHGGVIYATTLRVGETMLKIEETQWLVKHPDGLIEILWPQDFEARFIKPNESASLNV